MHIFVMLVFYNITNSQKKAHTKTEYMKIYSVTVVLS